MVTLTVASLGQFQLWRELIPVADDAWPTQKSKNLFKILLSARGEFVTADQLIEWLWPDMAPDKARNSLWVAVSQARRVLEPDLPPRGNSAFLLSTPTGYRLALDQEVEWDVANFLAACRRAQTAPTPAAALTALEEACAHYNGDYLAGDLYEAWAMPLRDELQRRYLDLLLALTTTYGEAGRYEDALTQAHAILGREPATEAAYQAIMRYAYYAGDQRAALQAYDTCVRVLRQELDVGPLPATTDLYRQIQRRTLPRPAPAAAPTPGDAIYTLNHTPFIGRAREFSALVQAIHDAQAGRGQVVLLEGEPGIGKSRLLHETLTYARRQEMLVLATDCYQVEQAIPYQPVVELLEQALAAAPANRFLALPPAYLAELATLSPELRELAPGLPAAADDLSARQARQLRALHQCLELLAGDAGLALAVDDVHWADHATWQFIHHLASHIRSLPLVLICTHRGEEIAANDGFAAFIDSMARTPHAKRLALQRLSMPDTRAFLDQLTGSSTAAEQVGAWLHGETDGNPFFLVSILQSMVDQRMIAEDRPIWQIDGERLDITDAALALPDALRESVRGRLRRLPQPLRRVLEAAAVLGRRFDFATLEAVSGEHGLALLEMIEALCERQFLRETGEGSAADITPTPTYDFSHDKLREVVYADLSSARRALIHRTIADHLAQTGGSQLERAANLAYHYERGQVWDRAFDYLMQAADHARRLFAVREAEQFYNRALALTSRLPVPAAPEVVNDLYLRRGEVRVLLGGQMQAAVDDLRRVLDAAQAAGNSALQRTALIALGQAYRMADQLEPATEFLSAALDLCRQEGDLRSVADVLYHLGTVAWSAGKNYHASLYHQEALDLAKRLGSQDLIAIQALHGRGEAYIGAARPNQALPLFEESLALAQQIGNKRYEGENLQMIGWAYVGLCGIGDYARACSVLEASVLVSRDSHVDWNTDITLCFLGLSHAALGDYRRGLALIQEGIAGLEADGMARFLSMGYDFLGCVYQDLNLHQEALQAHTTGLNIALAAQVGFWLPRLSANVAINRLRLGDLDAFNDLEATHSIAVEDYQRFHALAALQGLVEAGIARGEAWQTLRYAAELEEICQGGGLRELQAVVHRWRAAAHRCLGDLAAAADELAKAQALAHEVKRVRLQWEIHAEAAALALAQGRPGEADEHRAAVARITAAIAANLDNPAHTRGLPLRHPTAR